MIAKYAYISNIEKLISLCVCGINISNARYAKFIYALSKVLCVFSSKLHTQEWIFYLHFICIILIAKNIKINGKFINGILICILIKYEN